MKKQLRLVTEFHHKFQAPVLESPSAISEDRFKLRYDLMREEVEEYLKGARDGDVENVAKELSDMLYAVYGTILEHGLQDKIEEIFEEVHRSHMSKDYHQYKMVKGKNYKEANVEKFLE